MHARGFRAVPSLHYLDRIPAFRIGPDRGGTELEGTARPPPRNATAVPRGGLFWDGRAATLQSQALAPLFNPVEMANHDIDAVAARLRRAPYGSQFGLLFGARTVGTSRRLVDEAMFAVARFELEDSSFHPYTSKYDAYLEGKARLSPAELRGLRVFEDSTKGNCAACHVDKPGKDHRPPTFSDYEYEALGVPRNNHLAVNHDPRFHDLGLCGPARVDLTMQSRLCGLFRTPSLRNVATRHVFFHNGVFHSLTRVLDFYAFRDTHPDRVYPRNPEGGVLKFDDLPRRYQTNVDTSDPPFGRREGDPAPLTRADMHALIAFLETLTDGFQPSRATP